MGDHYSNETNGLVAASHKTQRQMVHRETLRNNAPYFDPPLFFNNRESQIENKVTETAREQSLIC